jgi:beta-lactamase class A
VNQKARAPFIGFLIASLALFGACHSSKIKSAASLKEYTLDYDTQLDRELQREIEAIDARVRSEFGMNPEHAALGVLDLRRLRLAMIHADRCEYAASVPKIGILLAYFHLRPQAATNLQNNIRRELGLMVKASNNEVAANFSQMLGLREIQGVLNEFRFYDATRGGGIWVGKHYGVSSERYGDPVGDNSHAATVRQLLRFYLMLEQGKLVSPAASKTMREIFESPEIPHDDIKFVKAFANENVQIIRKWGSWENWLHDSAVVRDSQRHYIIVGLTHHPRGDEYLEKVAQAVHRLM